MLNITMLSKKFLCSRSVSAFGVDYISIQDLRCPFSGLPWDTRDLLKDRMFPVHNSQTTLHTVTGEE